MTTDGIPPQSPTLLVTLTGDDRPGVTSALFDAVAPTGAVVLDLVQVGVRGQLRLAVLQAPRAWVSGSTSP